LQSGPIPTVLRRDPTSAAIPTRTGWAGSERWGSGSGSAVLAGIGLAMPQTTNDVDEA